VPSNPPPSQQQQDSVIREGDQVKGLYAYSGDDDKLSFSEVNFFFSKHYQLLIFFFFFKGFHNYCIRS